MREPEFIQARLGLGGNRTGCENGSEPIVSKLNTSSSQIIENKERRTDIPKDAKNQQQISGFTEELAEAVSSSIAQGKTPVILGGDHSISIGTMKGASKSGGTGVIWIDAHADFNTPGTSPSGNIHGMPVATAVGRGRLEWGYADIKEENVVMIGIRDVDELEQKKLDESKVTVYTMRDVQEMGIEEVVDRTLEKLSSIENVHVSFDLDFLDASLVPGVGTPVENGGTVQDAAAVINAVDEEDKLTSLDIVELNPSLDKNRETVARAVELLNKTVLKQKIVQ